MYLTIFSIWGHGRGNTIQRFNGGLKVFVIKKNIVEIFSKWSTFSSFHLFPLNNAVILQTSFWFE
jgi:hypothetical protein